MADYIFTDFAFEDLHAWLDLVLDLGVVVETRVLEFPEAVGLFTLKKLLFRIGQLNFRLYLVFLSVTSNRGQLILHKRSIFLLFLDCVTAIHDPLEISFQVLGHRCPFL